MERSSIKRHKRNGGAKINKRKRIIRIGGLIASIALMLFSVFFVWRSWQRTKEFNDFMRYRYDTTEESNIGRATGQWRNEVRPDEWISISPTELSLYPSFKHIDIALEERDNKVVVRKAGTDIIICLISHTDERHMELEVTLPNGQIQYTQKYRRSREGLSYTEALEDASK